MGQKGQDELGLLEPTHEHFIVFFRLHMIEVLILITNLHYHKSER